MNTPQDIDERLRTLASHDPTAADEIRNARATGSSHTPAPGVSAATEETVRSWLNEKGSAPGIIIALGVGRNGEAAALLALAPKHFKILLVECDPARAAQLFETCCVEEYVAQGQLRLALGRNGARVEEQFLEFLDIRQAPSMLIFNLAPLLPEEAEFYGPTLLHVRNRTRTRAFNLGTLVRLGPLWQTNAIKNIPELVRHPGISALAGLFPGKPAVVVAAGPSLNDALPHLAEAAANFVIISIGQALRPLRKAGIRPDLVIAVDANAISQRQFETECGDLYMACSSIVFPSLPARFRGIFSGYINSNPVGAWISSFGEPKGRLYPGGTVASSAIDLAVQMGCDPVLTVGLDLSMAGDGSSHARDTQYDGERLDTAKLIPVPGNHEDTVYTKDDFRVYIDLISDYVKFQKQHRFINANNSGAKIEGMELIPLEDIHKFAGQAPHAYDTIRERHDSFAAEGIEALCADGREIAEQMEQLKQDAVRAAMLCNRLIMVMRMPQSGGSDIASDCLAELRAIDDRISVARKTSLLLDMSLRQAYYEVGRQAEEHEKALAPAVLANRESRKLYEQMAGAATWTHKLLVEAINQIEQSQALIADQPAACDLHTGTDSEIGEIVHAESRLLRLTA